MGFYDKIIMEKLTLKKKKMIKKIYGSTKMIKNIILEFFSEQINQILFPYHHSGAD